MLLDSRAMARERAKPRDAEHTMPRWIPMAAGELLVWFALLDIFLTVLYARIGTSLFANRFAGWLWRLFRLAAGWIPRHRDAVLSFAGPIIVVLMLGAWTWILNLGTALIVWPNLGTSITNTSGPTDTSFLTALYAGGISLSVVGASNYAPQTTGFRMFYLFNSVIGTSVLSLIVTYLMQIYNALQRRAAVSLRAHLSTGETGDAADLVAGLGPHGQFSAGYSRLSEFAGQVTELREAYNLYPALLYFRDKEALHAMARVVLVALDAVSLIKSGLDDRELAWLKESAAVDELWRGCNRRVHAVHGVRAGGHRHDRLRARPGR